MKAGSDRTKEFSTDLPALRFRALRRSTLKGMTTPWEDVRRLYTELPIENGDVVFVLPDAQVVLPIDGLADRWDPTVRRSLGTVLREMQVPEVLLAIARPDAELLPQDHALWADLREELLGSGITVHPPEGLPAAA